MMQPPTEVNVLYLGMALDIMGPLLLVPNLTKLYAIDLFDEAYSPDGTFRGQQQEIRNYLLRGNDEGSFSRGIYDEVGEGPTHFLKGPSTITSDTDDGVAWRLDFLYDNIPRQLIFFYERNFQLEWPQEIKGISDVMMMGSGGTSLLHEPESALLVEMFATRTTSPFAFYPLWWDHKHFPEVHHLFLFLFADFL